MIHTVWKSNWGWSENLLESLKLTAVPDIKFNSSTKFSSNNKTCFQWLQFHKRFFTLSSSTWSYWDDSFRMTYSVWVTTMNGSKYSNLSKLYSILLLYISICFCFEQMILSSRKNCFLNLMNLYRQHFLEQVFICLDCLPLLTAAATFTASPVDVFKNDSLLQGCNDQAYGFG